MGTIKVAAAAFVVTSALAGCAGQPHQDTAPTPAPTTTYPTIIATPDASNPAPTPAPSVVIISRDEFMRQAIVDEIASVLKNQPTYVVEPATRPLPLAYVHAERARECHDHFASTPPKNAYTASMALVHKYKVSEFIGGYLSTAPIVMFPDQASWGTYGFGGQPYPTAEELCSDVR